MLSEYARINLVRISHAIPDVDYVELFLCSERAGVVFGKVSHLKARVNKTRRVFFTESELELSRELHQRLLSISTSLFR